MLAEASCRVLRKRDQEGVKAIHFHGYRDSWNRHEDIYARGVKTLTYLSFPREHWRNSTAKDTRRTRAVRCYLNGESALMLICARLRYEASKDWGTKGPEQEATLLT